MSYCDCSLQGIEDIVKEKLTPFSLKSTSTQKDKKQKL